MRHWIIQIFSKINNMDQFVCLIPIVETKLYSFFKLTKMIKRIHAGELVEVIKRMIGNITYWTLVMKTEEAVTSWDQFTWLIQ